jgi:hypothetical protein
MRMLCNSLKDGKHYVKCIWGRKMSDIAKQLRGLGSPLAMEAADEIDRLEKIIEHLVGHEAAAALIEHGIEK